MESKKRSTDRNSIKFLCSYGGKILPRVTDGNLRYVCGHTRVLPVARSISFSELMVKLFDFCGSSMTLRCQLPNGDLETLISIINDEDLASIIEEYDRASSSLVHSLKITAILSPHISLKKLSPTSSTASSVNFSRSSDRHVALSNLCLIPRPVASSVMFVCRRRYIQSVSIMAQEKAVAIRATFTEALRFYIADVIATITATEIEPINSQNRHKSH